MSVVVVTHNNESLIAGCLRAVARSVRGHSYEVVVVDNASSDGTLAQIPSDLRPARLIELATNVGFGAANNRGIDASRGRLVVLVNSDTFPDEGSVDRLIESIAQLPSAAILGGALRYPDGRAQPSVGRFPSLLGGLWVALFMHRLPLAGRLDLGISAHPALYRERRRVDWVTAAFCIARRDLAHLPERRFMYGEDVEWAWGCREQGYEVWFEPDASAVHIGGASVAHSLEVGFAQRQRVSFELEWFADRGRAAQAGARGVLVAHALIRLAAFGAGAILRGRRDRRLSENVALLRAALSCDPSCGSRDSLGPREI